MNQPTSSLATLAAALAAAGLVAACGGSDSPTTTTATATPAATVTTVSGAVVKGPVTGSNVCAYKAAAGGKGDLIKCTTSATGGNYTMDLDYVGDVVIEAAGGSYTDEATNTTKTLSDPLQVVLSSQGGATTGMVTPLTSVAYSLSKNLSGGVSSSNFNSAASTVVTQFQLGTGVNLATTAPVVGASANAYGKALNGVSKYVANGGTLTSFVTWSNPAGIQGSYSTAYNAANGGSVSFNFSSTTGTGSTVTGTGTISGAGTGTLVVGGTGAGGGTATCAVAVSGSATVQGFTVPISTKVCVRGLQTAAECSSGNASISQALAGQSGLSGAVNLNYTYSNDCTGSQVTVDLK